MNQKKIMMARGTSWAFKSSHLLHGITEEILEHHVGHIGTCVADVKLPASFRSSRTLRCSERQLQFPSRNHMNDTHCRGLESM